MKVNAWFATDTGRRRDHNEDSLSCSQELGLFAVADGMGGHRAGDRASKLAIETLTEEVQLARDDFEAAANRLTEQSRGRWFTLASEFGDEHTAELHLDEQTREVEQASESIVAQPVKAVVRLAARKAGAAVFTESMKNPSSRGMGTTLTALFLEGGRGYLVHVGDTRAYRFRDNKLTQLTEDHTWISEQQKAGLLSEAEAAESKYRHVITRSIGFESDVQLDSQEMVIEAGDCFLLCSDGLSNYVENDELESIITEGFYAGLPDQLVALANERGGEDNITVIVIYTANSI